MDLTRKSACCDTRRRTIRCLAPLDRAALSCLRAWCAWVRSIEPPKELGMAYSKAWRLVNEAEAHLGMQAHLARRRARLLPHRRRRAHA